MKKLLNRMGWVCLALILVALPLAANAQEPIAPTNTPAQNVSLAPVPASYSLAGFTHIYQGWNNCGPATLTMALTYYDYAADQYPAARWLKPNDEDKNVSPWQLVEYVNTQLPGTLRAVARQGGDLALMRALIANNFPVLVEAGYDPPNDPQGWMGHYLFLTAYDDGRSTFTAQDSFEGPNQTLTYDYLDEFWRHFNRQYVVVYEIRREAELAAILGDNWDERQNHINTLEIARAEATANRQDPFAWFNMGTSFVGLEMYTEAVAAYNQARNVGEGLPWRMAWYQFGWYEAYLEVGNYNDVIALAQATLADGGGQFVEETYYYAALAREALGERARAIDNLNFVLSFNPNFSAARELRDQLQAGT